ncbi:hypothetical protein AMECASPLE_021412 [Ameca splendens]|uniref:Uncharacterized protein n=1 Tax=Ameca splendens TaxID=208324 RepID=A0ABV1AD37_9TELE
MVEGHAYTGYYYVNCPSSTTPYSAQFGTALLAFRATVVGVRPITSGLLVQTPALSISVIVSLGKILHSPCLLMVVREPGGADCMAALLLSVCGQLWLHCGLPLSVNFMKDFLLY